MEASRSPWLLQKPGEQDMVAEVRMPYKIPLKSGQYCSSCSSSIPEFINILSIIITLFSSNISKERQTKEKFFKKLKYMANILIDLLFRTEYNCFFIS
jgi:hypothetical protein